AVPIAAAMAASTGRKPNAASTAKMPRNENRASPIAVTKSQRLGQPLEVQAKAELEHDQADREVDQRAQVEQHVVADEAERVRPERGTGEHVSGDARQGGVA